MLERSKAEQVSEWSACTADSSPVLALHVLRFGTGNRGRRNPRNSAVRSDKRRHLDLQIDLRAEREMRAVLQLLQDIARHLPSNDGHLTNATCTTKRSSSRPRHLGP